MHTIGGFGAFIILKVLGDFIMVFVNITSVCKSIEVMWVLEYVYKENSMGIHKCIYPSITYSFLVTH